MSVTAAHGFVAGGVASGIKSTEALDLAVVDAGRPVPAAGVFTRNIVAAPPVHLSREHLLDGTARAVVLSSGCANAATGPVGIAAARRTAELVADRLGCRPADVFVCSTGPIGEVVPVDRIANGLKRLALSSDGGTDAAEAILTTDSHSKEATVTAGGFTVGGMAKGAGMIRPDMSTMLAVLTTDAVVSNDTLDRVLAGAVARSFNALDIDGCESTNDSVILLASGASGVTPDESAFSGAVEQVCRNLTHQMAADAEGASRVVIIDLAGATDDGAALGLARAMADSALVRSAFYGADPNWGRLLAAMGASRIPFDPDDTSIAFAGIVVADAGTAVAADHAIVSEKLAGDFTVTVSVGNGPGKVSLITPDLTPDYVRFNGERS
ncbi:bifunctional glutamate N-acetyltransferase/amino-acid acetyltransferase ArgJ [soil metagenome]